jgi:hypothetical protein
VVRSGKNETLDARFDDKNRCFRMSASHLKIHFVDS